MKKYKFKLEALLKIRKLKEETCKMEIGRIQVEIGAKENEIKIHNEGIKEAFVGQERALKSGVLGHELRFHPYFVDGKRAHIKEIQKEIEQLKITRDEKFITLNHLRADVKVLDEMKQKKESEHRKKLAKKIDENIEEQVKNWKQILG